MAALMLALGLLTGCTTGEERRLSNQLHKPEETDAYRIQELVFGYLLEKDFGEGSDYSAVFLKTSDSQAEGWIRKLPNHVPMIKPVDRVILHPGRSPIDKETGKPAILLSAVVSEPTGDSADAIGMYYAGPAVTAKYIFKVIREEGQWRIESVRLAGS